MDQRRRITIEVKKWDRDLFCDYGPKGVLSIMRKANEYHSVEVDGVRVVYPQPCPQIVLVLTDDWTQRGKPVEWGLEPLMRKLKAIDTWLNPVFDFVKQEEKSKESATRHRHNEQEAFLKEFRPQFAKSFNDVNTSTLNKIDRRRDGNH